MKVRISIDKVAALKAGKDTHGYAVVEVPAASLTDAQRAVLAEFTSPRYGREDLPADFYLDSRDGAPAVAAATTETVATILNGIIARRASEREEAKRKHDERVATWLAKPVTEYIGGADGAKSVRFFGTNSWEIPQDERLNVRVEEAKAECARLNAEHAAKSAAEKAEAERLATEKKAQAEAGKTILRDWATANGSELLRERIANNFEWVSLAEQEYADSVFAALALPFDDCDEDPSGYTHDDTSERTTPTLEEIQALKLARERCSAHSAEVCLDWVTYKEDRDEDDYDADEPGVLKRAELEVTVTCPTGRTITRFFLPTAVVAA